MNESEDDLERLQALLDASYAGAGEHLLRIHTPERRLDAHGVTRRLVGMRLLALGTVTSDGRPVVGPVDSVFYRGSFVFGSAADSMRMRHIRSRPAVSATHVPGEHLAVTVHGRAKVVDLRAPAEAGLREALLAIYVPRYGPEWEQFMDDSVYARVAADRMYAYAASEEA